jgi:protein O-GlcNAc transferase
VIPPEEERFYSERIVRVPGSYLTFEVGYPVPDVADAPSRGRGAITFGCLAPQYKITGKVIEAWSRILLQVPASTLLLKSRALAAEGVRRFVHEQFAGHGIDPERIRLQGPAAHYRFLETYGEIDLALDTFPYNGGTTTSEALWQGVPVVAFSGDRWLSRTSASILHAAGLGEFVGKTLDDYLAIAVRGANAPERLAELRRDMRARLRDSAVCDTETFARNMERIYNDIA